MNAAPPSLAPASASPQRQTPSLSRPQTAPSFPRPLLAAFSRTSPFPCYFFLQRFSFLIPLALLCIAALPLVFSPITVFARSIIPPTPPKRDGDPNLYIYSKTDLHSANWIWSEEKLYQEYEGTEEAIVDGKISFPRDFAREKIGIGEFWQLRVSGKDAAIGSIEKAKWKIIEGSQWADIIGTSEGHKIRLGAKTLDGPAERIVKIEVETTAKRKANIRFIIVRPSGIIRSRHCGKPPGDARIPDTSDIQFSDGHSPESQQEGKTREVANGIGAWTRLVAILMPSGVNFGGLYEGGIEVKELDISSPINCTGWVFAGFKHKPGENYIKVWGDWSGFIDEIWYYYRGRTQLADSHSCDWICEWGWKSKKYNKRVVLNWETQKFKAEGSIFTKPKVTVKKFNSSVTRAETQIRDIEKDWEPIRGLLIEDKTKDEE